MGPNQAAVLEADKQLLWSRTQRDKVRTKTTSTTGEQFPTWTFGHKTRRQTLVNRDRFQILSPNNAEEYFWLPSFPLQTNTYKHQTNKTKRLIVNPDNYLAKCCLGNLYVLWVIYFAFQVLLSKFAFGSEKVRNDYRNRHEFVNGEIPRYFTQNGNGRLRKWRWV